MKGKDRAALRAQAHHLDAMVHVGVAGTTDNVLQTIDDALRTHVMAECAGQRTAWVRVSPRVTPDLPIVTDSRRTGLRGCTHLGRALPCIHKICTIRDNAAQA